MRHLLLFLYFLGLSAGVVLITLTIQKLLKYKKSILKTYLFHLIFLNFTAAATLFVKYIIINLAPDKEGITSGYYNLFMSLSFLTFIAMIGNIITFFILTKQLRESPHRKQILWIAGILLGFVLFVLGKGIWEIFILKKPSAFMYHLGMLDYGEKIILLFISILLFFKSIKLPHTGKQFVIKKFSSLYIILNSYFILSYLLRHLFPIMFSSAWPVYYLILNTIPLFYLTKFLQYYFGKKLVTGRTQPDLDSALEQYAITNREKEIIQLVLEGKSNKEIEDALFISIKTVKYHIFNIYQKLNIKNRLQLMNLLRQDYIISKE